LSVTVQSIQTARNAHIKTQFSFPTTWMHTGNQRYSTIHYEPRQ